MYVYIYSICIFTHQTDERLTKWIEIHGVFFPSLPFPKLIIINSTLLNA